MPGGCLRRQVWLPVFDFTDFYGSGRYIGLPVMGCGFGIVLSGLRGFADFGFAVCLI